MGQATVMQNRSSDTQLPGGCTAAGQVQLGIWRSVHQTEKPQLTVFSSSVWVLVSPLRHVTLWAERKNKQTLRSHPAEAKQNRECSQSLRLHLPPDCRPAPAGQRPE